MSGSVLVTGGAGFIGSHVCEAYRDRGWEVTAVDDLSSGRRENVPEGVELREIDVRDEALAELFDDRDFDLVNHQAAQIDVRVSVDRPRHDASVNVDGLLHVLEAARINDVDRLLFASSACIYRQEHDDLNRFSEDQAIPANPHSTYGWAKILGEVACQAYHQ
ncbi:MAG: NAD-dependent epimerase/dehydratase family protein, partial [Gemmatimonadota bacterium]